MLWLEILILLACIVVGARIGGMALGPVAGVGLAVFVFLLDMPPGAPPATAAAFPPDWWSERGDDVGRSPVCDFRNRTNPVDTVPASV